MSSDNVIVKQKVDLKDAVAIAEKGTHCGMCRFDFLGSGVCPAGRKHGFLAYWPQGRMEIVQQLDSGKVKPTEKLKDIVDSCNLCGICDKQCNFITQLRPEKVAGALKEYVENLNICPGLNYKYVKLPIGRYISWLIYDSKVLRKFPGGKEITDKHIISNKAIFEIN